jgi:hypothetical protein
MKDGDAAAAANLEDDLMLKKVFVSLVLAAAVGLAPLGAQADHVVIVHHDHDRHWHDWHHHHDHDDHHHHHDHDHD